MTRVRVALALVALAVLAGVGLMLGRALESAAVERHSRHAIVAERVFDEMERELSRWLEREEGRPLVEWRFFSGDPERAPRSPLSQPSALPFVVGHFAVDGEGRIHTPLEPRAGAEADAARARGEWPTAEGQARAGETRRSAERFWQWAQRGDEVLARRDVPRRESTPTPEPAVADDSPYRVLQKLNIAAASREARQRRYAEPPLQGDAAPEAASESTDGQAAAARLQDEASGERDRAAEERVASLEEAEGFAFGRTLGLSSAPEARRARPVSPPTGGRRPARRIALDPMVGRALEDDPGRLVLYRTAIVRGQALRQGVILDLDALRDFLVERVVAASGLAPHVRVRAVSPSQPAPGPGPGPGPERTDAYRFFHAFAEPFRPLQLWLELEPLPGSGSPGPLYALSALLVVAVLLGLFAIDRMVALTLDFSRRRADFVAAVSHELKTPVTALRMYAEMLRDGLVRDEAQRAEYHRTLADESERLARLVDNVLEFSRLERGQRELSLVAGNLGQAVVDATERLRPHAERLGFTLRVEVEPELPAARFERDALLQVLFNLVDNALKYAADSERREVLVAVERAGDGVVLRVRDFGPGVPPRQLARIFQPFYRGQRELTRSTRGTGIGLALVRQLGEAMGAAVSGANADDGGFEVRLRFGPA